MIDPSADGKAPHQPGVERLQQFGRRSHIRHAGIEPQVVAIWIKRDEHSVVEGRGHDWPKTFTR